MSSILRYATLGREDSRWPTAVRTRMVASFLLLWRRRPGWISGTRFSAKSWRAKMSPTKFLSCRATLMTAPEHPLLCSTCASNACEVALASSLHLFRVVNEFVFMLVGVLLVLFALTGHYLFNPRRPGWIALSIVLILWGLGTWHRARLSRGAAERLVTKIGGGSLALGGLIMISLAGAP